MKEFLCSYMFLLIGLFAWSQPELTIDQHLEDFDFAVNYIEENYSCFPNKVVDNTLINYKLTKMHLRDQVAKGERQGWQAVSEYLAWFDDFLCTMREWYIDSCGIMRNYTDVYRKRQRIYYEELMDDYYPMPLACKVTDNTFLVRLPSCNGDPDEQWIRNSISLFKESKCENFILDIRGNRGGNMDYWIDYWHLLVDHCGEIYEDEFRNTQNLRDLLYYSLNNSLKSVWSEEMNNEFQIYMKKKIEQHKFIPGQFVRQVTELPVFLLRYLATTEEEEPISQDELYEILIEYFNIIDTAPIKSEIGYLNEDNPVRKAALIIDNRVASSTEKLVLFLRATSERTTIYGRDNTLGCLDSYAIEDVELPNSGKQFTSAMARMTGLSESGINTTGIAPDIRINLPLPSKLTDNVDEWVIWVTAQLEK